MPPYISFASAIFLPPSDLIINRHQQNIKYIYNIVFHTKKVFYCAYKYNPKYNPAELFDDKRNGITITEKKKPGGSILPHHTISDWEKDRNKIQVGVKWHFTVEDARIKMKRLYPKPLFEE
jgi:hypothetical protein